MSVSYSPLCDTDRSAYFAYLVSTLNHGSVVVKDCNFGRLVGNEGCCGGRGYVGESLGVVASLSGVAGPERVASVGLLLDSLRLEGAGGCSSEANGKEFGSAGIPVGSFAGVGSGNGGGDGVEHADGGAQVSGFAVAEGSQVKLETGVLPGDAGNSEVHSQSVRGKSVLGAFGKEKENRTEVVTEKTLRNRERRRVKKELKNARKAGMKRDDWRNRTLHSQQFGQEKTELQKSLEAKWAAQNLLEKTRAERQLDILRSKDIEQEKRMQHSRMVRDTEKNLVAVEKAHGMLKATGNVPGFVVGTAETVVSGVPTLTSGSISPNSSVSEAEVRRMMKELEDLKVEHAKVVRRLRDRDLAVLESGGTVGFPADMSEGLENEIDQVIGLGREEFNYPEDPETVYIKRMPDSGDHWP